MREPGDDQTEPEAEPARAPGAYYYDDATGYQVFDPSAEEEEEDEGAPGPAGGAGEGRAPRRAVSAGGP